jgi:hypothetical protein
MSPLVVSRWVCAAALVAAAGVWSCGGGGGGSTPTGPSTTRATITVGYESSVFAITQGGPPYVGTFATILRVSSNIAATITHSECGLRDEGGTTTLVQGKDWTTGAIPVGSRSYLLWTVTCGPVTAAKERQWTTFCDLTVVDAAGSQSIRWTIPFADYQIIVPIGVGPTVPPPPPAPAPGPTPTPLPTPTPAPTPTPTPTPTYSCTNPPAHCNIDCGGIGQAACGPPKAMCKDGKWSCSTTGACSSHGGVSCWI